jgi:hypothetical protein
MGSYVTLNGYQVRRVASSGKAVGLVKEGAGFRADLIWVPISLCRDGDQLATGDTDIIMAEFKAIELDLDFDE